MTAESPALDLDILRNVIRAHPVRIAVLFGSHANQEATGRSDVDIAVELDGIRPTDEGYNDVFFGLSADLSATLETDELDLVDLHTVSPQLAAAIFDDGIILVGDEAHVETLRSELTSVDSDERSPRERLDAALENIDSHLDDGAIPATGDPEEGR